ncbi:hypothetical protein [Pontibacter sp. G13]|uniref:serine O-acetyltransferase n=1 Tax=Pontibacter sp. G13 TaxID=3074898 RepID=UPI00288B74EF|nr:hypothetical protein [Pontibacter sp. G13]WNJ19756.1 hypothetical protein RJD25_04675 [Pontibacter sp. G13]
MKFSDVKLAIQADLHRHKGRSGTKALIKTLRKSRSFKITFWFRLAQYMNQHMIPVVGHLIKWKYRRVTNRYCVDLPLGTQVGKGLMIYHCYGLVVHQDTVIGDNCSLSHQVTLAVEKGGTPVLKDKVRVSPGAKIVGGVTLGTGVVVGANSVVIKDVPDHAITVGIPNRIINRPYEDDANRYYFESEPEKVLA